MTWHTRLGETFSDVLSRDLREVGRPWLQAAVKAMHATVGPIALETTTGVQIHRITDVSKPTRRGGDDGGAGTSDRPDWDAAPTAHSLLQLQLTDGVASVPAIVMDAIPGISGATEPGCKLALHPGVVHVNGILCLTAQTARHLGGSCERLTAESALQHRTSAGREAGPLGAPPFVPFGAAVPARPEAEAAAAASSSAAEPAPRDVGVRQSNLTAPRDVGVRPVLPSALPSFEVPALSATASPDGVLPRERRVDASPAGRAPRRCTIVGLDLVTGPLRAVPQLLITLRSAGVTIPAACTDKLASALLRLPPGTTIASLLQSQPRRRAHLENAVGGLSAAMKGRECNATVDMAAKPFAALRALS